MTYLISSAYGREYLDIDGIEKDWKAGLDFTLHDASGKRSLINLNTIGEGNTLRIKYRRFTREHQIKT